MIEKNLRTVVEMQYVDVASHVRTLVEVKCSMAS